jgi:peptidoglycan-associated lipoprotein
MSLSPLKSIGFSVFVLSALLALGCHKNSAAAPPPPPASAPLTPTAPTPAPTVTLRAEPSTIDRGASTTLQWEARNAAAVTITPGLGDVAVMGNRAVNPTSSVTYTASASGPGGTASDTARVTVNVPAAPTETPSSRRGPDVTTDLLSFDRSIQDVTFDYDKADIRPDQVSVLQKNATWLKANVTVGFTIEGHCDERGSEEYNLGLGDRRANAVKEFLIGQGVPANRISTVSYGEERPVCREQTEDCYTRNRRAHFAVSR